MRVHTHTCAHTHTHIRTHTHVHTHVTEAVCCYSDDSDDDAVDNPLVAGDEDIDSEEDEPAPVKPVTMVTDTKSVTDDDNDDDDEADSIDKKNGRFDIYRCHFKGKSFCSYQAR